MKTENILNFFGGGHGAKAKIASTIKVSRAAVSKWGETVPDGSAYKLIKAFPELVSLITSTDANSMPQSLTQQNIKKG